MTTDAGWYPDPSGAHELRHWDGSGWTDQVRDEGNPSFDVVPPAAPPPDPADRTTPDAGGVPSPPARIGPWQRRLASAADRAAERGRELADQVGATVDERRARRRGR